MAAKREPPCSHPAHLDSPGSLPYGQSPHGPGISHRTRRARVTRGMDPPPSIPLSRRIHRCRRHGQPHGRQRAQGRLRHGGLDKSAKAMEDLVQGRSQGRDVRARTSSTAPNMVPHLLACLARRRGALSGAGWLRGERAPGHDPDRPQQRAAVDAAQVEPAAKKRGVHFLESPVSGGTAGAKPHARAHGGGDPEILAKRVKPVLKSHRPNFHVGPVGAGNTVKAINNMMACVNSSR